MRDDSSPLEKDFWQQFDAALKAAENPSAAEISRLTGEIIDHCVAESTIRGWLAHKRLPRDDEDFLAVIKVLQAEQRLDWLSLLRGAQKGRVARNGGGSDPPPEIDESSDDASHDPPRDRKPWRFALAGIGVAIVAIFATFALSQGDDPPRGAAERICAHVTSAVAQVFSTPGGDPYDKIAKYRGDRIVRFPDVPDAAGPDGRVYRAVRSPARANPGSSPYSWMLADDLSDAPCERG